MAGRGVAFFVNGFNGASIPQDVYTFLGELANSTKSVFDWNNDGDSETDLYVTNWNSPDPRTTSGNPGSFLGDELGDFFQPIYADIFGARVPVGLTLSFIDRPEPLLPDQFVDTLSGILDNEYDDDDFVVLIGHSLGGNSVLRVAQQVSTQIDLLATLDPVGWSFTGTTDNVLDFQLIPPLEFNNPLHPAVGPERVRVYDGLSVGIDPEPLVTTVTAGLIDTSINPDTNLPRGRIGFRNELPTPSSQIDHFFNRWQNSYYFPFDYKTSGQLNASRVQKDIGRFSYNGSPIQEQALSDRARDANGNPITRNATGLDILFNEANVSLDIDGPDFGSISDPKIPPDFSLRLSATTSSLDHADLPNDTFIQEQLKAVLGALVPQAPTAAAQAVPIGRPFIEGDVITLSSAGTFDPNPDDTLTYRWTQIGGPAVTLSDRNAANPTLTAIDDTFLDDRSYRFRLDVTDGTGGSDVAFVTIEVANVAPVLTPISGPDRFVRVFPLVFSVGVSDPGTADDVEVGWDFGDGTQAPPISIAGSSGTATSPSKRYRGTGTFTVRATATDDDDSATVSKEVEIRAAGLIPDPGDPSRMALAVGGTGVDDVIVLLPGGTPNSIDVYINYTYEGTFSPTGRILIDAAEGDDIVRIDGAITRYARVSGGEGDDTLDGGSGDDTLDGGSGDDIFNGGGGSNVLIGGAGFNVIRVEGTRFSDSITISGTSPLRVEGTDSDGTSTISGIQRVDVLGLEGDDDITVIDSALNFHIDGGDGGDTLDASGAMATTLLGGAGDDILIGSPAADSLFGDLGNDSLAGAAGDDWLLGEAGNDSILGGPGGDSLFGGDDSDEFVWDSGDGSDLIEGGPGVDLLICNGGAGADTFTLTAVGSRLRFDRQPGDATLDVADVEQGNANAGGGADAIVVNDLTDAQVSVLDLDLGADAVRDSVTLNGRNVADDVMVAAEGGVVDVEGLGARVFIRNSSAECPVLPDDDILMLNGRFGNDTLGAAAGVEELIGLFFDGSGGNDRIEADGTLNGGDGNDTLTGGDCPNSILGGAGDDLILGRDGNDTLAGQDGNDTVYGGDGDDSILGEAGDDSILGEAGRDTVRGGDGNDSILGGVGEDELSGGDGNDAVGGDSENDRIFGDDGDNLLEGGAGDDTIFGLGGADTLLGQDGNDILRGGDGNDILRGGDGNDALDGDSGDDLLAGDAGADTLMGQAGNDALDGGQSPDMLLGGEGNDILRGGDEEDTLRGESGDDILLGDAANDRLEGGPGADRLEGGDSNDVLLGEAGNDALLGGDGDDVLLGENDPDLLEGGAGNDALSGGAGNDTLLGREGDDTLSGDDGDDSLVGGAGDDSLVGGEGSDILCGEAGNDSLVGGAGNDVLAGDAGSDTLRGGSGDDQMWGGADNDVLLGEDGNDSMVGGDGDDVLAGGSGDDLIFGGDGNDLVLGGAGNDAIYGGDGDDDLLGGDGPRNVAHAPRPVLPSDGDDLIFGGNGFDQVDGGNSNNLLDAGDDGIAETILGGRGNDIAFTHRNHDGFRDEPALDGGHNRVIVQGGLEEPGLPAETCDRVAFAGPILPVIYQQVIQPGSVPGSPITPPLVPGPQGNRQRANRLRPGLSLFAARRALFGLTPRPARPAPNHAALRRAAGARPLGARPALDFFAGRQVTSLNSMNVWVRGPQALFRRR